MSQRRALLLLVISAACLGAAFYAVDVAATFATLGRIKAGHVAAAGLLILANILIAMLRFRATLGAFGYRPAWGDLLAAFSVSQVANQFLLNVVGQSMSRGALLAAAGVPFATSVFATYVERLLAAATLLAMSLVGCWILFLRVDVDLEGGGAYLLTLLIGMAVVGAAAIWTAGRGLALGGQAIKVLPHLLRFWPTLALTLAAHACMLGAYSAALLGLDLEKISLDIVAALMIVMFTASLPISFAGWGIRELSAAKAMGVIGVAPSTAVAAAIAIGLISLVFTFALPVLSAIVSARRRTDDARAGPPHDRRAEAWNAALFQGCAFVCAAFLFFHLQVPLPGGAVTVNVVDIVALSGLGLVAFQMWSRRTLLPVSRSLFVSLAAITALLAFSLALGYARHGFNNWALVNRGLGWTVILGYVAVGASIVAVAGDRGRARIVQVFAVAGVTVAMLQLAMLGFERFVASLPQGAFVFPLKGFSTNSNAFAFQLVMTCVALVVTYYLRGPAKKRWWILAAIVVLAPAIFYSQSRAGLVAYAFMLGLMVVLAPRRDRYGFALAALSALGVVAAIQFAAYQGGLLREGFFSGGLPGLKIVHVTSDLERWKTITEGLELWWAHPFFGAGLGAYVAAQLASGPTFLVIHSIPIWLLAETGALGFALVAVVFLVALRRSRDMMSDPGGRACGVGLLAILCSMGGAGLVHDFFYQRSFWFLLGIFLAASYAVPSAGASVPDAAGSASGGAKDRASRAGAAGP